MPKSNDKIHLKANTYIYVYDYERISQQEDTKS